MYQLILLQMAAMRPANAASRLVAGCLLWAESYNATGALGPVTRKSVSGLFYHLIDAQSRSG